MDVTIDKAVVAKAKMVVGNVVQWFQQKEDMAAKIQDGGSKLVHWFQQLSKRGSRKFSR